MIGTLYDLSPAACALRRAERDRIGATPGNRQYRRILALLRELAAAARAFDRDHPAGCRCGFCRGVEEVAALKRYVRGVGCLAESVEGSRYDTPETPEEAAEFNRTVAPRVMAEHEARLRQRTKGTPRVRPTA